MAATVTVAEATRGLKAMGGPATRRALSHAYREVAKEGEQRVEASWGKQRIRPTKARNVVRRRASQSAAKVFLARGPHPYAAGVAFGALQYRQFPRWVGNARTGATWKDMHLMGPELVDLSENDGARIFADAIIEQFGAVL